MFYVTIPMKECHRISIRCQLLWFYELLEGLYRSLLIRFFNLKDFTSRSKKIKAIYI